MGLTTLLLKKLVLHPDLQPREGMNDSRVLQYARAYKNGDKLPPLDVFLIDGKHYVAGGWHRYAALLKCGETRYPCRVHQGEWRDAILFAGEDNVRHGLSLTTAEKKRLAATMLQDEVWKTLADKEIARRCGLAKVTIANLRRRIVSGQPVKEREVRPDIWGKYHAIEAAMEPFDLVLSYVGAQPDRQVRVHTEGRVVEKFSSIGRLDAWWNGAGGEALRRVQVKRLNLPESLLGGMRWRVTDIHELMKKQGSEALCCWVDFLVPRQLKQLAEALDIREWKGKAFNEMNEWEFREALKQ